MKIDVYNQEGKKVDESSLPKEVFEVETNRDLLNRIVFSYRSNQRIKIAKTKDRQEVRGGGRKPWRQKGTGRARHGSIRSPLWKGGGVTFGPNNLREFKKIIPRKLKSQAVFMILSSKLKDNLVIVIDNLEATKTKAMAETLNKLPSKNNSLLVVMPKDEKNTVRSLRNIERTGVIKATDLNAIDLLSYKYVLMPKESIKVIKETFLKK